ALHVEGIYVLICRSPAWTQATLGPGTEDRAFPERDRLHLEYLLAVRSTKRQYDAELLDAVAFVRAALYANRNGLAPPESGGPWLEAGLVALGLLAVWLILALVRRALGFWGRHPDGDPEIAPCTGMAFAGGLAGGLAGAHTMTWLRDWFRGRHRETSAPLPVAPGQPESEPTEEDLLPTEHYGPDDGSSLERRAEEYGGE
ncbi:MAG TPA: hypothetical protein VJ739_19225, partial [Gemmataceae bacterium]|nr:hypothetical protein [Gemmataceae bacterium]